MSDTDIEFGDIEYDDLWDNEPPASEQVTYRIHELRMLFAQFAEDDSIASFFDLSDEEQELALAIGEVVVDWIGDHPLIESDDLGEHLHNVQVWFAALGGQTLPPWESLTEDQREVGTALVVAVREWLAAEGSWQ